MPDLFGVRPLRLCRTDSGKSSLDSRAYEPVSRPSPRQKGYCPCERAGSRMSRVESQLNVEESEL
eukprot:7442031-Alexandrium_andersonii.AAC.1